MTKLLLLPVLLLAACATRSAIEQSRDHARLGEHARAFQVLDDLRRQQLAAGSVDPELEAAHRAARLEFLRSRAQQNIFQEKEDLALADLAELEALAPDYPGVAALRERANRKKADRLAARGDECLIRKDFVGAMAFYLESQKVVENARATEGMEHVREATAGLSMRAREQFLEAVRKLPEFRHVEVQWHSGNALLVAPERDDARALQHQARRENALAAMRRAKANESAGRYGAALIDYRTAQRIDKETPGADEGIALMERELKAVLLMDRAQLSMRAGRFTDARDQLAEAYELSVLTRNDVALLQQQVRRLEAERRYRSARDLEVLGQKAAALAAFEEIAKEWPDGLLDEQARIAGLRADVEGARQEWEAAEAAEAAGNLQEALEHYRNSERFYAGWRDGAERIARLRDAIAKQASGGDDDGNG
jgi:hypothetical protein